MRLRTDLRLRLARGKGPGAAFRTGTSSGRRRGAPGGLQRAGSRLGRAWPRGGGRGIPARRSRRGGCK
eukprot:8802565-Lingulodinium_polyedra.AAC.1